MGRTVSPAAATRGFMGAGRACRSILDVRNDERRPSRGRVGTVQFRDAAYVR